MTVKKSYHWKSKAMQKVIMEGASRGMVLDKGQTMYGEELSGTQWKMRNIHTLLCPGTMLGLGQ